MARHLTLYGCLGLLIAVAACKGSKPPTGPTTALANQSSLPAAAAAPLQFDYDNPSDLARRGLDHLGLANSRIARIFTPGSFPVFVPDSLTLYSISYFPGQRPAEVNYQGLPTPGTTRPEKYSYPILSIAMDRAGNFVDATATYLTGPAPAPLPQAPLDPEFEFHNPSALSARALGFYDGSEVSPKLKTGLNRPELQLQKITYRLGHAPAEVLFYSPPNKFADKPGLYSFKTITIEIDSTGRFVKALPGTSYFADRNEQNASRP